MGRAARPTSSSPYAQATEELAERYAISLRSDRGPSGSHSVRAFLHNLRCHYCQKCSLGPHTAKGNRQESLLVVTQIGLPSVLPVGIVTMHVENV